MQNCLQSEVLCMCLGRGQGEALTVDRHNLYQALYRALGHACLSGLDSAPPTAGGPDDTQVCTAQQML